jgi:hypothetical protein
MQRYAKLQMCATASLFLLSKPFPVPTMTRQLRPRWRSSPAHNGQARGICHGNEAEYAQHDVRSTPQLAARNRFEVYQWLFACQCAVISWGGR